MEFRILGPLEVLGDSGVVALGGPKPRAVLAMLLLHANEAVHPERLAVALWGQDAPGSAARTVQVYVSRLRKALDDDEMLVTTPAGYCLRVRPGELDADRFASGLEDGRRALAAGRAAHAAAVLRNALALWRGPALGDLSFESFAEGAIARLQEQRLTAIEERVEADLANGAHAMLVGELRQLVAAHPTRERFVCQLMLALYRSGQQSEALAAFHAARRVLISEIGVEPGPELRDIQQAVLAQDPRLDAAAGATRPEAILVAAPDTPRHEAHRAAAGPLPSLFCELVGREQDVEAVVGLVRRPHVHLVSLIGPGGVGKTSLAIEIAHRLRGDFADGVAFVDLASLEDATQVAATMLRGVGAMPEPGTSVEQMLIEVLAARDQLLVLDNFEHLLAAAPLLAGLLAAGSAAKLLVTSRAALGLRGEQRYLLNPLALPTASDRSTVAEVAAAPATALFIERAVAQDRAFGVSADNAAAIARVCERVAGLPLAIELAAARCAVLSAQEIASDLQSVLSGVGPASRDAPARQRTLRATLDWSHALLDDTEQAVFARLSVFAGGCTLDAADQVAGAPLQLVEPLIAHSILHRRTDADGQTRLLMLEPIREYAAERLACRGDAQQRAERHSRYYLQLAETARGGLRGREQLLWQRRLDAEAGNLRRAFVRERQAGNFEFMVRLACALELWWIDATFAAEGRGWMKDALAAAAGTLPAAVEAEGLRVVAYLGVSQAELEDSLRCAQRAVQLFHELQDPSGMALALIELAYAQLHVGARDAAQATAAEARRVANGADDWVLARAHTACAATAPDFATATRIAAEAAPLLETVGDLRALSDFWDGLGWLALIEGALTEADELFERAHAIVNRTDSSIDRALVIGNRALVALETGDHVTAASRFVQVLAICRTHALRRPVYEALAGLGAIAAAAGDAPRAAQLAGACAATRFDQPCTPVDQRLNTRILDARRDCEDHVWKAAYAAGSRLSLHEAIDFGLVAASEHRTVSRWTAE